MGDWHMRVRGRCCDAGTKVCCLVNHCNLGGSICHEKTHGDIDGNGTRAGNGGDAGQRAEPVARCCELAQAAHERDADCQAGGVQWNNRQVWLRAGVGERVRQPLLPVRSLLATIPRQSRERSPNAQ
jgi:hypothetical protein